LLGSIIDFFGLDKLVSGTTDEKHQTLVKIDNISKIDDRLKKDVKENIAEARVELGQDMQHYGDAAEEVGTEAILVGAASSVVGNPIGPEISTTGGIVSTGGTVMKATGVMLEKWELDLASSIEAGISLTTRKFTKVTKKAINSAYILGRKGRNYISNILQGAADVIGVKTKKEVNENTP